MRDLTVRIIGINNEKATQHLFELFKEQDCFQEIINEKSNKSQQLFEFSLRGVDVLRLKLVTDPKHNIESATNLMIELRQNPNNLSYNQIAQRLNQFGYKTVKGKQFHKAQVKRILDKHKIR